MPQIIVTRRAIQDLGRLRDFLLKKNKEAADNAIHTIIKAIDRLAQNPYLGRELEDGIRGLTIKFGKYGYQAAYRYDDKVYILAIRSGREDIFKDL